jgi:hypothetical protein
MFYTVLFAVAALFFFYQQRYRTKRGHAEFRAMTPADLKALYERGGSLVVPTRLGKVVLPLMKAAVVTTAVYCGSIIATVLRSSGV